VRRSIVKLTPKRKSSFSGVSRRCSIALLQVAARQMLKRQVQEMASSRRHAHRSKSPEVHRARDQHWLLTIGQSRLRTWRLPCEANPRSACLNSERRRRRLGRRHPGRDHFVVSANRRGSAVRIRRESSKMLGLEVIGDTLCASKKSGKPRSFKRGAARETG